jgi:hypothetical protein
MLAANLVYATVVGRYPRLLGDDGIHEPLVLPYDVDGFVDLEFYREGGKTPIGTSRAFSVRYIQPDGTVVELAYQLGGNRITMQFPDALPAGGVCVILFMPTDSIYAHQCYPFRVLRPTETLAPFTSDPTDR